MAELPAALVELLLLLLLLLLLWVALVLLLLLLLLLLWAAVQSVALLAYEAHWWHACACPWARARPF